MAITQSDFRWLNAEVLRKFGVSVSQIWPRFWGPIGLAMACILAPADSLAAVPNPVEITSSTEYYSLSLESIKKSIPVRIPGVVLFCDPAWRMLFLRDASGSSLYVELPAEGKWTGIESGDRILLEGATGLNRGDRGFNNLRFKVLGPGLLPAAVPLEARNVIDPGKGAIFALVRGVVRNISEEDRVHLFLLVEGKRLDVWVQKYAPTNLVGLLDAKVRVEGVRAHQYNERGEVVGAVLYVSSFRQVVVEEPGPEDVFQMAATPINRLFSINWPAGGESRRMRIHGTVIQQIPGVCVVVTDETERIRCFSPQTIRLTPDQRVDVVGFPVLRQGERIIEDAIFRLAERTPAVVAVNTNTLVSGPSLPLMETAERIHRLPPDEARLRYPVKLRGVVTYYDASWKTLFIQDASGGIYVDPKDISAALRAGQSVEVTGLTDPGGYMPMVVQPQIKVLGEGVLPSARPLIMGQGKVGDYDCDWVEVQGVVQSTEVRDNHYVFRVETGDGSVHCLVPRLMDPAWPTNLIGATVRMQGVCSVSLNQARLFAGLGVNVPDETKITVVQKPPPDLFSLPARPISEVLGTLPISLGSDYIKVKGVVTLQRPGWGVFIQDATAAIFVQTYQTNHFDRGDEVEAVGFQSLGDYTPILRQARIGLVRPAAEPEPRRLTAERILEGMNNGQLVQIEARLLENVAPSIAPELVLQAGSIIFSAGLETSERSPGLRSLAAGSMVRLKGICSIKAGEWRQPKSFRLLLRSPKDIEVTQAPPFLNRQRVLAFSTVMGVAILSSLGWVAALRRRVRLQTNQIRQRLEHEAALEAHYRELVENANDIIFTHDLEGRFLSINRAGERLLGFSRSEVLHMNLSEMVAPEHLARFEQLCRNAQSCGSIDPYEIDVLTKDGRRLTLESSTRLIRRGSQENWAETIARDVTERKQAEERLRRSEAQLAEAQRIGHVGSWEIDLEKNSLELSAQAGQLFGLPVSREALTAEAMLSRIHPADVPKVKVALGEAMRDGRPFILDYRVLLPGGPERIVHNQAEVIAAPGGGARRLFGTVQDITDRKRFEEQLVKLSRAVEQSPAVIIVTDKAGNIEYVNPKFSQVTGYTLPEVVGRNPRCLKSGAASAGFYAGMWETITAGREWHGELQNRKKNGEEYRVSSLISPIKNESGEVTHFIAVQEDITEKHDLELQLWQAQKIDSIGQLAAGVAHDFNNILTIIQGHTGILRVKGHLPPLLAESVQEIERSSGRAADLTRQLLAFGRKQLMRTKVMDVNQVVAGVVKMLQRLLGEHISLDIHHEPNLPTIRADQSLLEQIIVNLAVNARDAMPNGGRLKIATRLATIDSRQARQHADAAPGAYVCLVIEDNGCGMDQATMSHLFEPFFTTKEVGKGTGLGLATVYGIARQHRGWISVTSEVNRGTKFDLHFPVDGAPLETRPSAAPESPVRIQQKAVLIVEDEPIVRELACLVLQENGFQTFEANSGRDALRIWGDHAASIDLLFTDMVMPDGISGKDLAQRLCHLKPSLQVIYSSGYSADLDAMGVPLKEGINFLPKPYSPTKLMQIVDHCLTHR